MLFYEICCLGNVEAFPLAQFFFFISNFVAFTVSLWGPGNSRSVVYHIVMAYIEWTKLSCKVDAKNAFKIFTRNLFWYCCRRCFYSQATQLELHCVWQSATADNIPPRKYRYHNSCGVFFVVFLRMYLYYTWEKN